jgi:uncharacterized membrane protein
LQWLDAEGRMDAKAKILGHPIHQMLIPLPLGLFVAAAVIDITSALAGGSYLSQVSFYNLVFGVISGLLAALFGWIDWSSIPDRTRAKRVGLVHGIGNAVLLIVFAAAAVLRLEAPEFAAMPAAVMLETGGLLLGGVTAWLGGELVDRLGIGVSPGANPNASSSLR